MITIREFANAVGLSHSLISWRVRHGAECIIGKDYFLLEGVTLHRYKIENHLYHLAAKALIVIAPSGVKKLLAALGMMSLPSLTKSKKTRYSDVPDNPEARLIKEAEKAMAVMNGVLNEFNRYHKPETAAKLRDVLVQFETNIGIPIMKLSKIEIGESVSVK